MERERKKRKGDLKMAKEKLTVKKILAFLCMHALLLGLLALLATVTFWGTFFVTVILINAIRIYGLANSCAPPIFSAFIAGLAVIYILKESRQKWENSLEL